jgi:hypothetical protein
MNAAGIDWMLIANGSQPTLEDQICSHGRESFPPQHITDETGHGRHDVRVIRAVPATDAIKARWPGAAQTAPAACAPSNSSACYPNDTM